MIQQNCPTCGDELEFADDDAGEIGTCTCGQTFYIRSKARRKAAKRGPGFSVGGCVGAGIGLIVGGIGGIVYHGNHLPAQQFHGGGIEQLVVIPRAFVGGLIGIAVGLLLGGVLGICLRSRG